MNKSIVLGISLVILSLQVHVTHAKDNWYFGMSYSNQSVDSKAKNMGFDTAEIIIGYQISDLLSIESRASKGVSGYESSYNFAESNPNDQYFALLTPEAANATYSEDINWQASILLKGSLPLTNHVSLYGFIGWNNTQYEINGWSRICNEPTCSFNGYDQFDLTIDNSQIQYGSGINYRLFKSTKLFLEANVLPDFEPSEDVSYSRRSLTLGFNVYF